MIYEPNTGIPVVSHHRMREDARQLEMTLSAGGVTWEPNSIFGQALDSANKLADWQNRPEDVPIRAPEVIRRVVGLAWLARTIYHAQRDPKCLFKLRKLLKKITLDNPIPTEPLEDPETARNFVFELEIASLFMSAGLDVRVAEEPDVTVEKNGRWNFACKMISSMESNTVGGNLAKGWRQVLREEFQGHYGMVVMRLGQRLDHEGFLPLMIPTEDIWGTYTTLEVPKRMLLGQIEVLSKQILSQATTRIDDSNPRFRGVVVIGQTVTSMNKVPALLTAMRLITVQELFDAKLIGPEEEMIATLNDEAQLVFAK